MNLVSLPAYQPTLQTLLVPILAFSIVLLGTPSCLAQSNNSARVTIHDAILVNHDHALLSHQAIPFSTPTRLAFLPYIAYIDQSGVPRDYLMNGVVLRLSLIHI